MTFENLIEVSGPHSHHGLVVLTLSTCGFCKRAMSFLQEQGFAYSFTHLDTWEPEKKTALKATFKLEFGQALAFPALIVDDKDVVVGFIESKWRELLGVPEAKNL